MIEIRHLNGTVLYTAQYATNIRSAVEDAVRARADLTGADLARASLADADLAGADLARASLADANLAGANLAVAATGSLLNYGWYLHGGSLSYGCEKHALADWTPELIETLSAKHESARKALFVSALTALVALCRALPVAEGVRTKGGAP